VLANIQWFISKNKKQLGRFIISHFSIQVPSTQR
jgi:hypothetical protein